MLCVISIRPRDNPEVVSPAQVSVAMGCAARDRNVVFASTLASFLTRAYDQLRAAAISESNINLCGSHCGLSTGQSPPGRSLTSSTFLLLLLFLLFSARPLTSQLVLPSPALPTHPSALDDVSVSRWQCR